MGHLNQDLIRQGEDKNLLLSTSMEKHPVFSFKQVSWLPLEITGIWVLKGEFEFSVRREGSWFAQKNVLFQKVCIPKPNARSDIR